MKDVRLTLFHLRSDILQFLFNIHKCASSFLLFHRSPFFFPPVSQNSFPPGIFA